MTPPPVFSAFLCNNLSYPTHKPGSRIIIDWSFKNWDQFRQDFKSKPLVEPNSDVCANSHVLYRGRAKAGRDARRPWGHPVPSSHARHGAALPGWDTPGASQSMAKPPGAGNPRACSPVLPVCLPQLPLQGQTFTELGGGLLSEAWNSPVCALLRFTQLMLSGGTQGLQGTVGW